MQTYPVKDKYTSYTVDGEERSALNLTSLIGTKNDGKRIEIRVWMDTFEVEKPRYLYGSTEYSDHTGLGITAREAFNRMKSMMAIVED